MSNRKEIKQKAKEKFLLDKAKQKERKLEISKLSAEQKKLEKNNDRLEKKKNKKERKLDLKNMDKQERKLNKRHDKYYKKLKRRPIKYSIIALLMVVIVFVGYTFGPVIGDISNLMSIELTNDTPEAIEALEHGEEVAEMISDEGIVLLKNDEDFLPLTDKSLNVFGFSALNFRLSGGGSGGADQSRAVSLFDGLSNSNISYNTTLYDYYNDNRALTGKEKSTGLGQVLDMFMGKELINEPDIKYLTEEMIKEAQSYSSNAMVVISSSSVEASDATVEDLRLSKNQRDLLETVTANFENVIVIINAGNTLELAFLEEYPEIKAALWVGTPGSRGANSLGKILTGEVNPSGRLTDTYVYDVSSHPSVVNFGDYEYTNIDGIGFMNYEEGIYVGYRYFETYYQKDEAGYEKTVQYPFGYGLSYTDFEWKVLSENFDDETISIDIEVTNTGEVPGKDVVQVYFKPPYYEGGIEKSSIELAGYEKTKLLNQGESEVVTISFDKRDMSSYDMEQEAYVLEAGDYEIKISNNVHKHILSLPYEIKETIIYKEDEVTGTELKNLFGYADGNLRYLSRNDWENTYPNIEDTVYEAEVSLVEKFYARPEKSDLEEPTTGAENNILLKDLKGLEYDDPKWQLYLDQFTVDEMKALVTNGAYRTVGVERLGLPSSLLLDGPAGINFFFKQNTAAAYPTEIVIASTWNDDLAYKMGEAIGMEANAYGVDGWYAPGMNIHRSPLGGRNFEYLSEDPLLSGKISANMVAGAQSKDILVFMKHFALNEQEVNARSGIMIWANEQAIRELYLRPFEITVKEAEVTGVMSSFVHFGHKWAGGNPELLEDVLREEWGFVGVVSTDAVLGDFMDLNLAMRYGNDLMLSVAPTFLERDFDKLYKEDPSGFLTGVRERVHNICYALLNYTNLIE
ncbi:glycoside hydrolase family 3 protein [Oceanirhabdus sp. W0125-5]|uniref:glycoside hydrolase family 3 protein n=1 Tax=Oceanirhabdus sp. W0125-5 TaxID=2999116 RepID=UPI0022F2D217|nr:glycoside hydrolase family 3 protein [Oceanirhabdus sp. W0125-5]WBW94957.1 glycoside hydrolase family 3 C-terminal domain-containing protein [Oceanirhabdus sp. W0125-5]